MKKALFALAALTGGALIFASGTASAVQPYDPCKRPHPPSWCKGKQLPWQLRRPGDPEIIIQPGVNAGKPQGNMQGKAQGKAQGMK